MGINLAPDATTLLQFRHLLEKHGLTRTLFETITRTLVAQGLMIIGWAASKRRRKECAMHFPFQNLEREKSLELSTYTLARYRSTN